MLIKRLLLTASVLGVVLFSPSSLSASYPTPVEGDWAIPDFQFHTGEHLRGLRLHYRTIGSPTGEPVLILHGTTGDGARFLASSFADELYGPGQSLDAGKYFIILPDSIGHGKSAKPSDELKGRFPHYNYADMVSAQYRLVSEHLGIRHLRLIIGGSMGGMHAWLWGEMYPDFMDALMPLQCLPVEIAGMNRMLRRVIIDGIRNDPEWRNGEYEKRPTQGLTVAAYGILALFSYTPSIYNSAPTRKDADSLFAQQTRPDARGDANDVLYAFDSATDYDPAPELEKIRARVIAINTADDSVNPPELGVMERMIARVRNGRYVLIPRSGETSGHGSYGRGKLYKTYITDVCALSNLDRSSVAAFC
jgi:homoserine O-acetyltransferase/O-succinyltransferase